MSNFKFDPDTLYGLEIDFVPLVLDDEKYLGDKLLHLQSYFKAMYEEQPEKNGSEANEEDLTQTPYNENLYYRTLKLFKMKKLKHMFLFPGKTSVDTEIFSK